MATQDGAGKTLRFRLLGPLAITRGGHLVELPASRKLRALAGYLAMASQPVTRSQLCDLLWDGPNDPRGELRWCLSRLRSAVDEPGLRRVQTREDTVRLMLDAESLDAAQVAAAMREGPDQLPLDRLRQLAALFAGDFLEGLETSRAPAFNIWLLAERRRLRGWRIALLERIVRLSDGDAAALPYLEQWQQLVPFDLRVHEMLLHALARQGRLAEGETHLQAAARLFESEELDHRPLRAAWATARMESPCSAARVETSPQPADQTGLAGGATRRAALAVMPFGDGKTGTGATRDMADWLTTDVVMRLSRLRSFLVISQGTTFALRDRWVAPADAARMLNVDYLVNGVLHRRGERLAITVELSETRSDRILWTEAFVCSAGDALQAFDELGNRIADRISNEIDAAERLRATLKPPASLTAWETYHRGMWHFYHFEREQNRQAQACFQAALDLDPTFSRAYAGLSFTHYQNAFQGWADRTSETENAYAVASRGLMIDDRDPAVHEVMGRALWLRGRLDGALAELETAIDLSPNFVPGHYTLSFFHCLGGDPHAAITASDHSRQISPFDPLMFAMLASRAVALLRLKRFDEAADWASRAAARPNAHLHVQALSAYASGLAGRIPEARAGIARIRRHWPHYGVETYLAAMRLAPAGAAMVRKVAQKVDA
jgi:DNA-binding SARP family transcriptional activator/TolB-like protein